MPFAIQAHGAITWPKGYENMVIGVAADQENDLSGRRLVVAEENVGHFMAIATLQHCAYDPPVYVSEQFPNGVWKLPGAAIRVPTFGGA